METNETTALPIRGDRLLLFLDVLYVWIGASMKDFSPKKIDAIIRRFVSDESNLEDPTCRYRFEEVYEEACFLCAHTLLSNAQGLESVIFDVNALIGFNSPLCDWYFSSEVVYGFHQLLRAIASGELTETDFKK